MLDDDLPLELPAPVPRRVREQVPAEPASPRWASARAARIGTSSYAPPNPPWTYRSGDPAPSSKKFVSRPQTSESGAHESQARTRRATPSAHPRVPDQAQSPRACRPEFYKPSPNWL